MCTKRPQTKLNVLQGRMLQCHSDRLDRNCVNVNFDGVRETILTKAILIC